MLCYDCCVDIMYVVSDLGEWNDDNDDVIGQDETRQGAVSILFNVIELLFFFLQFAHRLDNSSPHLISKDAWLVTIGLFRKREKYADQDETCSSNRVISVRLHNRVSHQKYEAKK